MKELLRKIGKTEIRNVLSVFIVLGCFSLLGIMLLKPIPTENKDILNIVGGMIFGGALTSVTGYYFGSSKTEAKKESE